ncbi:MAG: hypothetical protein HY731_11250 [Candidatus Tectomicrobia bacterium]|nr:hypothetical protein [Candidatus Tectomicrobia bacterium]
MTQSQSDRYRVFEEKVTPRLWDRPLIPLEELTGLISTIMAKESQLQSSDEQEILVEYWNYHFYLGYSKSDLVEKLVSEGWQRGLALKSLSFTEADVKAIKQDNPIRGIQRYIREVCLNLLSGMEEKTVVERIKSESKLSEEICLKLVELGVQFLKALPS